MNLWTIDRHDARPSTWWWWFWLFFIKGGKSPRQLMILWSTKNCKQINVNGLDITLKHDLLNQTGSKFHGAVAAWYYDGKRMHEDFVLKDCNLSLNQNGITTDAGTYSTQQAGTTFTTKIEQPGAKMRFLAEQPQNEFAKAVSMEDTFMKKFNFKISRLNHLGLSGEIGGKKIDGSAYFQKVQVNAPSIPWFWGMSHFDGGEALTYFFPYLGTALFNKSGRCRLDSIKIPMRRLIRFFDGEKIHEFNNSKIKILESGETPSWEISAAARPGSGSRSGSGARPNSKIKFTVEAYSHACWRFEEQKLLKNILHYNEYPMKITEFKMGGLTLDDLGPNMGNAEHTWGRLL